MCPGRDEARRPACHLRPERENTGARARVLRMIKEGKEKPTLLFFRHASIGTNSLNTILPSSRLLLPVLPRPLAA